MNQLYHTWALRSGLGFFLALIVTMGAAQNSMIGDGFGGRLWYRPTNYGVGSYSAFSLCNMDTCDSGNNQLYGWGQFLNGGPFDVPMPISAMNDVRYFSAGYNLGVIKDDNTCWAISQEIAVATQLLSDVSFVDAGAYTMSFVKEDGSVWSIGNNDSGAFGDGTQTSSPMVPVQMLGITNAVRVACAWATTYVLLADGTVYASGSNVDGMLGDPTNSQPLVTTPVLVGSLSNIVDIKANYGAVAALDVNGDVYCWGLFGLNGLPNSVGRLESLSNIVAISGSNDGYLFLALDAEMNCYSWGTVGFIPNGFEPNLLATDVVDIMAGESFAYYVSSDGSIWAAGVSNGGSIWLGLPDLDGGGTPIYRPEFVQLDLALVPSSCQLIGTVAFPTATCGSGTITVYHFGGQAPYQYDIGNGPQPGNVFTDVPLGNYSVTVTDAGGCMITVPCTVVPDSAIATLLDMGTVSACVEEGFALPSGTTVFSSGNYSDTIFSSLGCDTVRLFNVVIDPLPGSNFQITLCEGEAYMLPNGVEVFAPGTYSDTLVVAGACDSVYIYSLILSTLPPVVAQVATPDSSIAPGDTVLLSPSPGSTFGWYPSTGLSCTACTFPLASPTVTTEYCVVVSDSLFSCGTDTACLVITVIGPPSIPCAAENIFVPTAFSPDASGMNDQQCVQGAKCISSMNFAIYDRWGLKVFETSDAEACWDGTFNGQALDPAVFVYHLIATLNNGGTVERQGNITLVR